MNRWQHQTFGRFAHMQHQGVAPGDVHTPRLRALIMAAHAGDQAALAQIEQESQNPAAQAAYQQAEAQLQSSPDWNTYQAHLSAPAFAPPPSDVPSSPLPPYATPHLAPLAMAQAVPSPPGVRPVGTVPVAPRAHHGHHHHPAAQPMPPQSSGAWGHLDEAQEVGRWHPHWPHHEQQHHVMHAGAWGHQDEAQEVGAWGHQDEAQEVGRWHPHWPQHEHVPHWQEVGRVHSSWPLAEPVGVGAAAPNEFSHWVSLVQSALNRLSAIGYRHGGEVLAVDGILGPKTKHAIAGFQRAHGLEADGIPGPLTRKKLGEVLNAHDAYDAPFATHDPGDAQSAAGYVPHPDWRRGRNTLGQGAERILRMEDLVDRLSPPPPWDSEPEPFNPGI